jgi:prolipoprotein diacylglyceryltransferase
MAGLLVLLGILRQYAKTKRQLGQVTLAGNYVLRFLIEYLRADNAFVCGMHTSTQVLCVVLLLASFWALFGLKPNKTPLQTG